jgi:hypothetical protein
MLKIFMFLFLPVLSVHAQTATFNKEDFRMFIKYAYVEGILSKEREAFKIIFDNKEDERFFVKKIELGEKCLRFRHTSKWDKTGCLRVISINKKQDGLFQIVFVSVHGGTTYRGDVILKNSTEEIVIREANVVRSID